MEESSTSINSNISYTCFKLPSGIRWLAMVFFSLVLLWLSFDTLIQSWHLELKSLRIRTTQNKHIEKNEPPSSKDIYLRISPDGRLGNQLFEWLSAKGIAKKLGIKACGSGFGALSGTFDINMPTCPSIPCETKKHGEHGYATYEDFHLNHSVCLENTYLQSYKYFDNLDLNVELVFKPKLLLKAKEFLKKVVHFDPMSDTLVAVHVRRGDIATAKWSWHNFPPNEYLALAIKHFEEKFQNVKFIVATNGFEWTKANPVFNKTNVFFTGARSPVAIDFTVLSHCHHAITTLGTFGWWIGFLTGGDVFYFFDQFKWDHHIPKYGLTPKDFWPENWIKVLNSTLFPKM